MGVPIAVDKAQACCSEAYTPLLPASKASFSKTSLKASSKVLCCDGLNLSRLESESSDCRKKRTLRRDCVLASRAHFTSSAAYLSLFLLNSLAANSRRWPCSQLPHPHIATSKQHERSSFRHQTFSQEEGHLDRHLGIS